MREIQMSDLVMIHVLLPVENEMSFQFQSGGSFLVGSDIWTSIQNVELGGVFYDFIRDTTTAILGVRYWLMDEVIFDQHQVFKFFLDDPRFFFNQADSFVDILFDKKDIPDFKNNLLLTDSAQDFGGDSVITNGEKHGIAFKIDSKSFKL